MKKQLYPEASRFFQRGEAPQRSQSKGDPSLRLKNGSPQNDAGRDTMKRDWLKRKYS